MYNIPNVIDMDINPYHRILFKEVETSYITHNRLDVIVDICRVINDIFDMKIEGYLIFNSCSSYSVEVLGVLQS